MRRGVDARVHQPGGAVEQAFDRVGADDHLAELVLDRAEAGDRLAELPPRRGVFRALADRPVRTAAAHGAQLETREVEHVERDLVPLADLTEDVVGRHFHVLENQRGRRRAVEAHLVLFLAALDAKRALHEEGGELLAHPPSRRRRTDRRSRRW